MLTKAEFVQTDCFIQTERTPRATKLTNVFQMVREAVANISWSKQGQGDRGTERTSQSMNYLLQSCENGPCFSVISRSSPTFWVANTALRGSGLLVRCSLAAWGCQVSHLDTSSQPGDNLFSLPFRSESHLWISPGQKHSAEPWSRARDGEVESSDLQPNFVAGLQPHQAIFKESDKWKLAPIDFISITSARQSSPKMSFKYLSGRKYRVLSQRKSVSEYISQTISKEHSIQINISTVYAIPEDMQLNLQAFCLTREIACDADWIRTTHFSLIIHYTISQMSTPTHQSSLAAGLSIINHFYLLQYSGKRIWSIKNSFAPEGNYRQLYWAEDVAIFPQLGWER